MHSGHQEFVVAGILHDALAACDRFFLVHVVVRVDFRMVLLQCVTVHQVADDEQVPELECGMAWRMDGCFRNIRKLEKSGIYCQRARI